MRAFLIVWLVACSCSAQAQPSEAPKDDPAYQKLQMRLEQMRARNTEQFAIHSKNGIDEAAYVSIGGIEQWITIRGQDRANPVLLFLHGGPGDVTNPWAFAFFAPWEQYFTVVQWDQRGAGRTLRKNGRAIAPTMTIARMAQDGVELAEYLRSHLHKDKIIVVAHSFGSMIALQMIRAKPELFYAYVGTGQVADSTRNYSAAYDALLRKAQATGNREALEELRSVGPPPYKSGQGYRVQRKWSNRFEGADQFLYGTIGQMLVAPGNSAQDFIDDEAGQMLSGETLVDQTTSLKPQDFGLKFAIPIFFFQGAEDFTSPTELARQYLGSIQAPKKEFVSIPGAGHFAMFIRSAEFLDLLVKRVRPIALKN